MNRTVNLAAVNWAAVNLAPQPLSRASQNPANCQLLHRKISRNSQLSQAGR